MIETRWDGHRIVLTPGDDVTEEELRSVVEWARGHFPDGESEVVAHGNAGGPIERLVVGRKAVLRWSETFPRLFEQQEDE